MFRKFDPVFSNTYNQSGKIRSLSTTEPDLPMLLGVKEVTGLKKKMSYFLMIRTAKMLVDNGLLFPIFLQYTDFDTGVEHFITLANKESLNHRLHSENDSKNELKVYKITIKNKKLINNKLREIKQHKRSEKGMGSELRKIKELRNDNYYIPTNTHCFVKCVIEAMQRDGCNKHIHDHEVRNFYSKFCVDNTVINGNFPRCKIVKFIREFNQSMGVMINVCKYEDARSYVKPLVKEFVDKPKMLIIPIMDHYVLIYAKFKLSYEHIIKYSHMWIQGEMTIDDSNLKAKPMSDISEYCFTSREDELYENVWIYDLECYLNTEDIFETYCVGFALVKCPTRSFKHYDGDGCIRLMVEYIDGQSKPLTVLKNGKFVKKKIDVYLYAHNGKKFDAYMVLQQRDIEFVSIVKSTAGILLLTVRGFNANIIFQCTLAHFQYGSLKKLCAEYDIPKQYWKSEFDHNKVNKDNWRDHKSEWLPYLKLDVISLSLIWRKYIHSMHQLTKLIIGD